MTYVLAMTTFERIDMPMRFLESPKTPRRPSRREIGMALALTALAAQGLARPGALRAQTPERLVAAGGAITEIIYALGLQERLVGVDSTSLFPPEALKTKPNIGYVRALSAEGVLSLKPSLVLAIPGAGPSGALSLLNEAGVRLAVVPDDPSAEGVVAKIEAVGALLGAVEPARLLAAQAKRRFAELDALRASLPRPRRVLFLLSLANGRIMVGGRDSSAAAIIALAGGVNAGEAIAGFKPMSDEAIIAAAPDVILTMRTGSGAAVTSETLFAMPAFAQTPAAARKALLVMDGLYLLGFGPRTAEAARDLMAALYPERHVPPLQTASAP